MEILFSDENIIVCIKPIGTDSEHGMCDLLKESFNGDIYVIHRLDLNVSGVMVYARNKQTAAYFSKLINDNKLTKEYRAIVHGLVDESDILEDLLFKDSRKNKVFVVKRERKGVKKAKLEYKRISHNNDYSYVHIRLYTGRTHQIRVQFASRKHPLAGDHKYGSTDLRKTPMLYSCRLSFPYHGKDMVFESIPRWDIETMSE